MVKLHRYLPGPGRQGGTPSLPSPSYWACRSAPGVQCLGQLGSSLTHSWKGPCRPLTAQPPEVALLQRDFFLMSLTTPPMAHLAPCCCWDSYAQQASRWGGGGKQRSYQPEASAQMTSALHAGSTGHAVLAAHWHPSHGTNEDMILCPCSKIIRDSTDSLIWQCPGNKQSWVPNSGEKKRLKHLKYLLRGGEKRGLPGSASGKELTCQCRRHKRHIRDMGSIPGSGRSPGRGHGSPLQYPCLENPMDSEAWGATIHRVAESRTQLKRLSRQAGKQERPLPKLCSPEPTFSSLLKARWGTEGL